MFSPLINLIILFIFGFLIGSIPFGYLISKLKGVDIKKVGSGNIGGTNVSRALGFRWGLLVSILDLLKAVVPVFLALKFLSIDWQVALVAAAPILGHVFTPWLKFKGGKGIACFFGVLITILPWRYFLIWLFFWLIVLMTSKIMSFTNLLMVSFLPLLFWLVFHSWAWFGFGIFVFVLVWYTHRENLKRIKQGTESKLKLRL